MAIVSFNRRIFEKEIGKINDKMQHSINMFGTPIEKISDEGIEIEVAPNRPDLLFYHGFKRSFLTYLGQRTGIKEYKLNPPEKDHSVLVDSSVKKTNNTSTVCAVVKGILFDDASIKEIIEIQEKLHLTIGRKRKKLSIGIYPLEKISFPITFKAMDPEKIEFIPLGSNRAMSGFEILEKHPAGREYAYLLAGLEKFPVFFDASQHILSMPPVINSQLTGKVTKDTRDVFIEISGLDIDLQKKTLNIIVTSLADMGGEIYQVKVVDSKDTNIFPDFSHKKWSLSLEETNKRLGLNLAETQLKELVERMGHKYNKGTVESPCWRTDLLHEVDLIEDVAVGYGYDNFEPEIPQISTFGGLDFKEVLKRRFSEIVIGMGFLEVSNYHLTTKNDQFIKMGFGEKNKKNPLEVAGSKTEYNFLRMNLNHYLLKNFSENVDSLYPQKIFEIGKVFDEKLSEEERLALAIAPGNFTETRQMIEYLFKMLNLSLKLNEPKSSSKYFISGRVAEIYLENKKIGELGEIHPKILRNWKIKMPVSLFEIGLEEIFEKLK